MAPYTMLDAGLSLGSGLPCTRYSTVMRLLFLALAFAGVHVSGQIVLRINDAPPVQIAAGELAKLPRHTAVLNNHGKQVSYEGALLRDRCHSRRCFEAVSANENGSVRPATPRQRTIQGMLV